MIISDTPDTSRFAISEIFRVIKLASKSKKRLMSEETGGPPVIFEVQENAPGD
jgi:hypothetical protein